MAALTRQSELTKMVNQAVTKKLLDRWGEPLAARCLRLEQAPVLHRLRARTVAAGAHDIQNRLRLLRTRATDTGRRE